MSKPADIIARLLYAQATNHGLPNTSLLAKEAVNEIERLRKELLDIADIADWAGGESAEGALTAIAAKARDAAQSQ